MVQQIRRIEQAEALDAPAKAAAGLVGKLTGADIVKNALSGGWLGHQLHPMLTDIPIGAWVMASFLDLTAGSEGAGAARRLVGLGVVAVVPTAASGAADWADTYGPEQRVGYVHAVANSAGTLLQAASWMVRGRGRHRTGMALSVLGLGITGAAAYLGGHLSLVRGVGVNHTAFEPTVVGWTDVAADDELIDGEPLRIEAEGVAVVVVRRSGLTSALSAVCTHAGGPLDEGTVAGDCVTCPWHGSRFRLDDGSVQRGPASVPQPKWHVLVRDGRVQVRSAHR